MVAKQTVSMLHLYKTKKTKTLNPLYILLITHTVPHPPLMLCIARKPRDVVFCSFIPITDIIYGE